MGRNIVVCCDGTGNEYGAHNTNVVGVFEAIVRDAEQVGFYDPGVGTFSTLGRGAGKWAGKVLGKGFGWGLRQNIEDAYEYLMNHYEDGDRLYLFGFSRGAYTARSLGGMLHKCGLLQRGSTNLMSYASEIYNARNNRVIAEGFKESFCQPCKPYFVGVWDTVASMGYFSGRPFFDADLHAETPYGYHALSIDEQRRKFLPSIWNEKNEVPGQIVEQVWFPGVHSDVGGSYEGAGALRRRIAVVVDPCRERGLAAEARLECELPAGPDRPRRPAPIAHAMVEALAKGAPDDSQRGPHSSERDRSTESGDRLRAAEPTQAV